MNDFLKRLTENTATWMVFLAPNVNDVLLYFRDQPIGNVKEININAKALETVEMTIVLEIPRGDIDVAAMLEKEQVTIHMVKE